MEGIYIYTNIDKEKQTSGEYKKSEMQITALESYGHNIIRFDLERNIKFNKFLIRLSQVQNFV